MLFSCILLCCLYILTITWEKLKCTSVKDQIFIQSSHPFRQYPFTQLKGYRLYMQISPWLAKNPRTLLLVWVFLRTKLTVVSLCGGGSVVWCFFAWFPPFRRTAFILTGMEKYSLGRCSLQETATHSRCALGTDSSNEDFMKKLDTNSRTGASQSSPRLKSTKCESRLIFFKASNALVLPYTW